MPVHEIPLPVGAKNIEPHLPTITRASKDGNIPVAHIFGGDKFAGDILEGQWAKCVWSGMSGPRTILISSGQLEMYGRAATAGLIKLSWINGQIPFCMVQDSYVDVHLKVPTVDPDNEFGIRFYLRREKSNDYPYQDDDYIRVELKRTATPLTRIFVEKNVNGSATTLYSEATVTNDEGTFRIKFRPNDNELDIYFHDGSGDIVETTDELTLISDTLDVLFDVGYPAIEYFTENDVNRTVISETVDVHYPDIALSYDLDIDDVGKGDVKCYDTMDSVTESDWHRVYAENHDFIGDCVIENGLVRIFIDDGVANGLKLSYWTGSAWSQPFTYITLYQDHDAKSLVYPYLQLISQMKKSEEITIKVRLCDTASETSDYNSILTLTLARGKYHVSFGIESVTPTQTVRFMFYDTTNRRWQYCGDVETNDIGDYDFPATINNTTMTDNFMMTFDDAGAAVIGFIATNQKPNQFYSYLSEYIALYSIAIADFDITKIHVGLIPFSDIADLFIEAEDATLAGGAISVVDATASGGYTVELDAISEQVTYEFVAGTDIPLGRYLFIVRVKDTAQVTNDVRMSVYNNSNAMYINEENTPVLVTATSSYAFYTMVVEFSEDDDGGNILFDVRKATATTNTISVDYFLMIPIGNGVSFAQDMAHNAMRSLDQGFRLIDSATYSLFAGTGIYLGSSLASAYSDAMAVAAVEAEPTLDLTGILTAPQIKVNVDNQGIYVGAGDDFRIYHSGTHTYMVNTEGDLFLQCAGGDIRLETTEFFLDVKGKVTIRDTDDADVVLWELDTDGRTLKIGSASDAIVITFNDVAVYNATQADAAIDADILTHANIAAAHHALVTVNALPLTLSGQAITFNYDTNHFQLDGNNLRLGTDSPSSADVLTWNGSAVVWSPAPGGPGSGTQWKIPVWATISTLGDSMLGQDSGGTKLTMSGSTFEWSSSDAILSLIGDLSLKITSDDAGQVLVNFYHDVTSWVQVGYNKTDDYGFIKSYHPIRIQPSNDFDDYIEFSTTSGEPKIKGVGADLTFDSDTSGAITLAQIYALLMYGSGKSAWEVLSPNGDEDGSSFIITNRVRGQGTGAFNVYFTLVLPTEKGTQDLFVDDIRFNVLAADLFNYITAIYIYGISKTTTATIIQSSATNYTDEGAQTWARSPSNVSAYSHVVVRFVCQDGTLDELQFTTPQVKCYYA